MLALRPLCIALVAVVSAISLAQADEYEIVRAVVGQKCLQCHGGDEINGDVDLAMISSRGQLIEQPELMGKMINVIDGNNMPPEDEPQLAEKERAALLAALKMLLRESAASQATAQLPIRRLNRFQYNQRRQGSVPTPSRRVPASRKG